MRVYMHSINKMQGCGLNSFDCGQGPVACYCKQGSKTLASIKGKEFHSQLLIRTMCRGTGRLMRLIAIR